MKMKVAFMVTWEDVREAPLLSGSVEWVEKEQGTSFLVRAYVREIIWDDQNRPQAILVEDSKEWDAEKNEWGDVTSIQINAGTFECLYANVFPPSWHGQYFLLIIRPGLLLRLYPSHETPENPTHQVTPPRLTKAFSLTE